VLEPLDSHGSCHPVKATAFHRHHRVPPVPRWPLRSRCRWPAPFAPRALPRFSTTTEQSAPDLAHRYFRPRGASACAFSLAIASQFLKFRTKARNRFTPPVHRTSHGQYV